jgi:hypothetical protein
MVNTVTQLNQHLDSSKARNRIIRIRTKHPDETSFDAIVLQNEKSFAALRNISDFEPDGIVVVPKKWLKSIRDGKFEALANEVVRFSRTLERGDLPRWPSGVSSLPEVLTYLKEGDLWPAIEIVYSGGSPLYMGPITEVTKKKARIYCYDGAGEWEKEYDIDLAEIFKIEIESRYTRHFNAYMKARRRPGRKSS